MESPLVSLKNGKLQGKICKDFKGNPFYSFQGIPYAEPPINNLRFKSPRPGKPWNGILDATKEGNESYSKHMIFQNVIGSEDCLYLNVYTPKLQKENLLPVMVFIHGGGFITGSSNSDYYGPEFLITEEVVIVTFNYRLGVLGFLSAEDPSLETPGNNAFKDMVMALQWVQENIENFSGNARNVTIFGQSAGAAACNYLMLSPMSQGLFHKVIMQSGCSLCIWTKGMRLIKVLAKLSGLETNDEGEALEFLRKLPVEKLFEAQEKIFPEELKPYGFVVEHPTKSEPNFMTTTPEEVLRSGNYQKVPLIVGFNNREGMLYKLNKKRLEKLKNVEEFLPFDLKDSPNSKKIAGKIKRFYYKNQEPSFENEDIFYKLKTDILLRNDLYKFFKYHLETSPHPLFYYQLTLETKLNFYKIAAKIKSRGVCHGDDISYFFKQSLKPFFSTPDLPKESVEMRAVERFVKYWTNFAKFGNPNEENFEIFWPKIERNKYYCLVFGENLEIVINPDEETDQFWENLEKLSKL